MEESPTKRSNAPSTIYTIAKLAETAIKRDLENLNSIGGEHPELKCLKEKCKDADPIVSISAGHALVTLVEAGVLSIPYTLSTFIAILPYCLSPIGVTSALAKLLILDLKMRVDGEKKYKSPFNLQSPQHPLLTVVKQNKDSWHHVVNQIASLCNHPDTVVQRNSSELVRPVVLYMMCDPSNQNAVYHQELWAILLSLPDTTLLEVCLPWLQATDPKCIQSLYVLLASSPKLKENLENSIVSNANIVIQMAGLVYTLVSTGADPCRILRSIDDFLPECCTFVGSCLIVTLAQAVLKSPSIYLSPIICLCSKIIKQQLCIVLAGKMLVASLLPWLAQPSILTAEALQEMQNLMSGVDNLSNLIMSSSPAFLHSFSITHTSVQTCILLKSWLSDTDTKLQWMNEVEKTPTALRKNLFLMIGGLIIEETTSSVLLSKCLSFMLKLTADLPELGTDVLTWFLYRLAREKEPENQLQLLRALPSLGSQKENVALVIHTLESLKESRDIKCLVLNLYLRLWHQEPRCFPYLHKMLSEPMTEKISVHREWTIACAATMKEICDTRPSLHGTDLVPLLSNVLNNSMGNEGAVASSFAIQAIVSLCEARIVDVATTWKALAPRLSRDTRVPVIRSLCELLGLMSNIKPTNTDQSKLFAESQAKLWSYVVNNNDGDVKVAALRGLSQFSLEQFSLKILPSCFRQNLKLPPEYAKTPIDAARKPEDVLPYIPGECWPQLLAAVPSATVLLKTLLSVEVSAMRGALHRHPGKAEPSLPSLPRNSVCLGLISHLRRCADEPDTAVVPCLEVLSSLSKALPPCDWSYLQSLAKHEQCHFLCLTLATRQAHCSPSARAVAEQLVEKLGTRASTKDDVLAGFTILEDLCKGVPPKTLRPLIENALQTSLKTAQNKDTKDESMFRELMRHMKRALQKEDIHDANRTLLSMILEGILEQLSLDDEEVFSCYVETVGELSSKFLDRMSSPSVWWEVTPVKLQKAIAIRSHIAIQADSEAPLIWLNECIDAAAATNPREQDLLLSQLYGVLVFSHGKGTNKDWVLELMGHIQAALTSTDKLEEASFLCDVFALAVVVLSGHHCLCPKPTTAAEIKEMRLSLLPQALLSVLEYPEWKSVTGQIIEWLHHLIKSTVICPDLKPVLYKCLQALRHTGPMQQPSVWQRVVSV